MVIANCGNRWCAVPRFDVCTEGAKDRTRRCHHLTLTLVSRWPHGLCLLWRPETLMIGNPCIIFLTCSFTYSQSDVRARTHPSFASQHVQHSGYPTRCYSQTCPGTFREQSRNEQHSSTKSRGNQLIHERDVGPFYDFRKQTEAESKR